MYRMHDYVELGKVKVHCLGCAHYMLRLTSTLWLSKILFLSRPLLPHISIPSGGVDICSISLASTVIYRSSDLQREPHLFGSFFLLSIISCDAKSSIPSPAYNCIMSLRVFVYSASALIWCVNGSTAGEFPRIIWHSSLFLFGVTQQETTTPSCDRTLS